jgi:hypothetical protein
MAFDLQSPDPGAAAWSKDHTQDYLTANPLPPGFLWPHRDHRHEDNGGLRPVQPSHSQVTAYGKWLRETPYFPGLFERIHAILTAAPDLGDAEWLAASLLPLRPGRIPPGQARAAAAAARLDDEPAY